MGRDRVLKNFTPAFIELNVKGVTLLNQFQGRCRQIALFRTRPSHIETRIGAQSPAEAYFHQSKALLQPFRKSYNAEVVAKIVLGLIDDFTGARQVVVGSGHDLGLHVVPLGAADKVFQRPIFTAELPMERVELRMK